jgi:hypothetical protein
MNDGNTLPPGNTPGFFGQKVSKPGIDVNSAGDSELVLKDDYSSRVYYNDNGIPTVLLGLRRSTTPTQQGLYVSKDGVDVTQASDSQLVFNSNQDLFKIVLTGTLTNTPPNPLPSGNSSTVSMAHNLGFTPAFVGYLNGSGSSYLTPGTFYQIPYITFILVTGTPEPLTYTMSSDGTNIYATISNGGGVGITDLGTTNFKFFLLQETAN